MGREDVRKALQAMEDPAVCKRLGEGDFSAVPGVTLDEQERALVRDAAAEYPDVTGLALGTFGKVGEYKMSEFDHVKLEFPKFWNALAYLGTSNT